MDDKKYKTKETNYIARFTNRYIFYFGLPVPYHSQQKYSSLGIYIYWSDDSLWYLFHSKKDQKANSLNNQFIANKPLAIIF